MTNLSDERIEELAAYCDVRSEFYGSAAHPHTVVPASRYAELATLARMTLAVRKELMIAKMTRTALATVEPCESVLIDKLAAILGPRAEAGR